MMPEKPMSLEEFRKTRPTVQDVTNEFSVTLHGLDRFACWITERVGTMGFFLIILIWTLLWLGWNLAAPPRLQFDPPMGFVLWLFISNLIQILLMPLIMVGQNIQGRHAEARAQSDLEINVRAEEEIEIVLQHLEYQNGILMAMMQNQGMSVDKAKS